MIGWLVALGYCAALCGSGWFWVKVLVPTRPPLVARLGLAFLVGAALVTLAMLIVAFSGLPITRTTVVASMAAVTGLGRVATSRLPVEWWTRRPLRAGSRRPGTPFLAVSVVALMVTLVIAVTTAPVGHIDFIRAWGVKGVAVFTHHDFDFSPVAKHWRFYPLELPNLYAGLYLLLGRTDEHLIKLPLVMYGASLAAALWWLCRLLMPPAAASLAIALTVTTPVFLAGLTNGLADTTVACYITISAVFAFLWARDSDPSWAAMSGFAAGAAAWSKLEGAPTGLVILAGALLVAHGTRRRGAALWLIWFAVMFLPWQLYQRVNDVEFARAHFRGMFLDLPFIGTHVTKRLLVPAEWGVFWIACLTILVLSLPAWWRTSWRALAAVTLPNVIATAGAYILHHRADEIAAYQATTSRLYLHVAPGVAVMTAAAAYAAWQWRPRRQATGEPQEE